MKFAVGHLLDLGYYRVPFDRGAFSFFTSIAASKWLGWLIFETDLTKPL